MNAFFKHAWSAIERFFRFRFHRFRPDPPKPTDEPIGFSPTGIMCLMFCVAGLLIFSGFIINTLKHESSPPSELSAAPPASRSQTLSYFTGTPQAVDVHIVAGREKGPTLLIIGGIHGDEAGGYMAAERYRDAQIKKGNLIIIPRLNAVAISRKTRHGLSGDMNRLFDRPENSRVNPDLKVVDLARSYIKQADYVLNLHQAYDFYARRWVSKKRNPLKWGQCNVIDIPIFHLPNGYKLEVGNYAQRVARRTNEDIRDRHYHFEVNNTDTAGRRSRNIEQKGSLTFYALYKQHKVALGMEATKNCTLPQAVSFLTKAVNAAIGEAGIEAERLPAGDIRSLTISSR